METSITSDDGENAENPIFTTTNFIALITTILVTLYYIYNKYFNGLRWEDYGVPHASFGIQELPVLLRERLMKEYGPTVGIVRSVPVLITRDLDLVKQVLVKDFNNFVDRGDTMYTKSPVGRGVFFLKGKTWRRIRQLMSPSFSTGKLKLYNCHVQNAAIPLGRAFIQCAEEGTTIDILHITGQYATSIIARTAFGVRTDCIGESKDDEFTHFAKNTFKSRSMWTMRLIMLMYKVPSLRDILVKTFDFNLLDTCTRESTAYFTSVLEEAIAEREETRHITGSDTYKDILQSLLSAKFTTDHQNGNGVAISAATSQTGDTEEERPSKNNISKQEVIDQACFIILAAFETTASTLQFCFYKLAQHPDVQEKVYEELISTVQHDPPTYEELSRLHYTKQVIDETLRLFPPVAFISRVAQQTRTYGHVTIPSGTNVSIPIREIHRDPDTYQDPDNFDPERFSDHNTHRRNPLAFMPFGQGQRMCIGMRLAYLEVAMALAQVIRKVKVELNSGTVPPQGEDIEVTFLGFPRAKPTIKLAVRLR